jgi:hypothetical protein
MLFFFNYFLFNQRFNTFTLYRWGCLSIVQAEKIPRNLICLITAEGNENGI